MEFPAAANGSIPKITKNTVSPFCNIGVKESIWDTNNVNNVHNTFIGLWSVAVKSVVMIVVMSKAHALNRN